MTEAYGTVRPMLHGTLTVEDVAGTFHDMQKYGRGKGDGKVWRQRRLDPWHGKNFAGEHDYVDTDWDSHSQSLTGCTAYEEETDMAFNTEETYGQGLIA